MAFLDKAGLEKLWSHILRKINNSIKQPDWNQTDETQKDFIKNKPDENDALAILSEMGLIEPIMSADDIVFTDNNGAIYIL